MDDRPLPRELQRRGRGGRPLGTLLLPRGKSLNKPQRSQRAQRTQRTQVPIPCCCSCSSLRPRLPLWFVQSSCSPPRPLCSSVHLCGKGSSAATRLSVSTWPHPGSTTDGSPNR